MSKERFTYSDYIFWPEDERWELIEGVPYNMSHAPTRRHQEISINISTIIENYLRGKNMQSFCSSF
jgi:hypothetical protein